MKNLVLSLMLVMFFGLLSENTLAQEEKKNETKTTTTKNDGKPFNTICPVSHEEIDEEFTYEYEGKTYAVCCNSCMKKFKKDPEKYIKKLSEDGKSIKKDKK